MDDFDLHHMITFRLSRLQARLNAQASELVETHSDLTLTGWRVILCVAQLEPVTAADIARGTQLDKGMLSRAVAQITKQGYLRQSPHKRDQRRNLLHLTSEGRALHDRLFPIMQDRLTALNAGFSPEDRQEFDRLLKLLEHQLDLIEHAPGGRLNH